MHFRRLSNNDVLIILYNQEGWKKKTFTVLKSRQEKDSEEDDLIYMYGYNVNVRHEQYDTQFKLNGNNKFCENVQRNHLE